MGRSQEVLELNGFWWPLVLSTMAGCSTSIGGCIAVRFVFDVAAFNNNWQTTSSVHCWLDAQKCTQKCRL